MPLYDYRCGSCSHDQVEIMSIAKMENPDTTIVCEDCGQPCTKIILANSLAFMSPESLGRHKAPGEFRDFLGKMKKAHKGSVIRDH